MPKNPTSKNRKQKKPFIGPRTARKKKSKPIPEYPYLSDESDIPVHFDSEEEEEYFDEEGGIPLLIDLNREDIEEEKKLAISELIEKYWKVLEIHS